MLNEGGGWVVRLGRIVVIPQGSQETSDEALAGRKNPGRTNAVVISQ